MAFSPKQIIRVLYKAQTQGILLIKGIKRADQGALVQYGLVHHAIALPSNSKCELRLAIAGSPNPNHKVTFTTVQTHCTVNDIFQHEKSIKDDQAEERSLSFRSSFFSWLLNQI